MTTPTLGTEFPLTPAAVSDRACERRAALARGAMIGGGQVTKEIVKTTIRHSIFTGSAQIVYRGTYGQYWGIYLLESPDEEFMNKMLHAVQEALGYIRALPGANSNIATLAERTHIVAITPLPAVLAKRSYEVANLISGLVYYKTHRELEANEQLWAEFRVGLTQVESDLDWQALGISHRVLEKALRATFYNGNDYYECHSDWTWQDHCSHQLDRILATLAKGFDAGTPFAAKALPVIASICLALLTVGERAELDDHLRAVALGQQVSPIDLGKSQFAQRGQATMRERGYSQRLSPHPVVKVPVYPFIRDKWLENQKLPVTLAYTPPEDQSRFLYLETGKEGIVGWQAAKPSCGRQTVYVSQGLAAQLAENPLALAEILIEEVGAHLDINRPAKNLKEEEELGRQLRDELLIRNKHLLPALATLRDLLPEVADDPTLALPWKTEQPALAGEPAAPGGRGSAGSREADKRGVVCPHCGKVGHVRPDWLGRGALRCPQCRRTFVP